MKAIQKVVILGGGTMGADLAALMLQRRKPVIVKEVSQALAERVKTNLERRIDGWKQSGRISDSDVQTMKELLAVTDNYRDLQDEGLLVIEAVPENMELKQRIFAELEENLPQDAIFASNTSSLPITLLAASMKDTSRLLGLHFFNPPTKMPLVEVILSRYSSTEAVESVERFAKKTLQKTTIRVKDCPGFLVNRLLLPYLNEAAMLLTETDLTPEAIDAEAKKFGWPMGPFVLMDFLGIDVCAEVAKFMHVSYGERAEPAPLLKTLVKLNRFGAKTGNIGFYGGKPLIDILNDEYPKRNEKSIVAADGFNRMMLGMVNEAFHCLGEGVSSAQDIDTGSMLGIGFPMTYGGVLHWSENEKGLAEIADALLTLSTSCGSRFLPAERLVHCVTEREKIFEKTEEEGW